MGDRLDVHSDVWRAELLLRSPRGLGALAGLSGLRLRALLKACSEVPRPEIHIGARRLTALGELPRDPSQRRGLEEWMPLADRYRLEARTIDSIFPGALTDPERLVAITLDQVTGWAWNPDAQDARQYLLAEAGALRDAAIELIEAPAAHWWCEPLWRRDQILLGSTLQPPDIRGLAADQMALISRETWRLPQGLVSSTRIGEYMPAIQVCDPEVTSRLPQPIGCWRVPVGVDARIYELHVPSDWIALCELHPRVIRLPREFLGWGIDAPSVLVPDWPAVAAKWDGLHVSMSGLLTTAGLPLVLGNQACLLEEIDTEQTVWFRPHFDEPEFVGAWHDGDLPQ